jgi:DNA gyrase inhibitor GyrI
MADEYEEERDACINAHNEYDDYDDNNDITPTTSNPLGIYQDDFRPTNI